METLIILLEWHQTSSWQSILEREGWGAYGEDELLTLKIVSGSNQAPTNSLIFFHIHIYTLLDEDRTPREQQHLIQSSRKLDCQWSTFGPWTPCTKPCGIGVQRRQRKLLHKAQNGGSPCRIEGASETRLCNRDPCGSGSLFSAYSFTGAHTHLFLFLNSFRYLILKTGI